MTFTIGQWVQYYTYIFIYRIYTVTFGILKKNREAVRSSAVVDDTTR